MKFTSFTTSTVFAVYLMRFLGDEEGEDVYYLSAHPAALDLIVGKFEAELSTLENLKIVYSPLARGNRALKKSFLSQKYGIPTNCELPIIYPTFTGEERWSRFEEAASDEDLRELFILAVRDEQRIRVCCEWNSTNSPFVDGFLISDFDFDRNPLQYFQSPPQL